MRPNGYWSQRLYAWAHGVYRWLRQPGQAWRLAQEVEQLRQQVSQLEQHRLLLQQQLRGLRRMTAERHYEQAQVVHRLVTQDEGAEVSTRAVRHSQQGYGACVAVADLPSVVQEPKIPAIPADPGNGHLAAHPYTLLAVCNEPALHQGALQPSARGARMYALIEVLYVLQSCGERNLRLNLVWPAHPVTVPAVAADYSYQDEQASALQQYAAGLGVGESFRGDPSADAATLLRRYQEADVFLAFDWPVEADAQGWAWHRLLRALHHELLVLVATPDLPVALSRQLPAECVLPQSAAVNVEQIVSRIRAWMHDSRQRRRHWQAQSRCQAVTRGLAGVKPQGAGGKRSRRIRIEGPWDSSYSLALVNRELALALDAAGNEVSLWHTDGMGDTPPSPELLMRCPQVAVMEQRFCAAASVDVTLRNLYPPRTLGLRGLDRIIGPYGWEESAFPAEWIEGFNRRATAVLCLSDDVRAVLKANGLQIPAVTTGLVADFILRTPALPPPGVELELPPQPRLLHVSSGFPRKGVDVLLQVMTQLPETVSLVIKTFPNPHQRVAALLAELGYLRVGCADDANESEGWPVYGGEWYVRGRQQVLLINADWPTECLRWLYESCDMLVAPSRGEGFGLPLAEAMLLGLPVVTTERGGQRDFCLPESAWLVACDAVPAHTHLDLPGSCWWEPRPESLRSAIEQVLSAPSALRQARTDRARQQVQERYSSLAVARVVEAALARVGAETVSTT